MFVSMQLSSHQISFLIIKLFNQCTDNIKLIFFVHKILSFANIKIFLIGIIFPYQLEALHRKCWRIRQTEIFHILVRVKSFMVRGKLQYVKYLVVYLDIKFLSRRILIYKEFMLIP